MKTSHPTQGIYIDRLIFVGLLLTAVLGGLGSVFLSAMVETETLLVVLVAGMGAVVFGLVVVPVCARRPVLWVAGMLLALAVFPNSSVLFEERISGEGFTLFKRYLVGAMNIWDVLLLVLLGFILLRPRRFRLFRRSVKLNRPLMFFFGVWGLAMLNGLVHATVWRYGWTSLRSVVQQSLPALYLVLSYLLARSVMVKRQDIDLLVRVLCLTNLIILIEVAVSSRAYAASCILGLLGG